jgi:signal transduction histidine kinase
MQTQDREWFDYLERSARQGELSRPLVHEFSNFLNTLLLQVALMEKSAPPAFGPDLDFLRQECKKMALLIQAWQQFKHGPTADLQPLDLNEIIRAIAQDPEMVGEQTIELKLSDGPLWVNGSFPETQRLCLLLLRRVKGHAQGLAEGKVVVQTRRTNKTELAVWNSAQDVPEQGLSDIERAASMLEYEACKSLAHRLNGRLVADSHGRGSLVLTLETSVDGP